MMRIVSRFMVFVILMMIIISGVIAIALLVRRINKLIRVVELSRHNSRSWDISIEKVRARVRVEEMRVEVIWRVVGHEISI